MLERTHSTWLAELADVVFAEPLAILLIVVVAATINWLVRRAIGRFVGAMVGEENTEPPAEAPPPRHQGRSGHAERALDTGAVSIRAAARPRR